MKLAFLASSLFVVAACGGKSKPAGPGPGPDNGGGSTGPVYLSMFEMGASWKFDFHEAHDGGDEETQSQSDYQSTCSVTKVSEVNGIKLAEIACDGEWPSGGMDSLSGTWAANDRGVWHLEGTIDENPEPGLADDAMILAATPVAKTDRQEDSEMEGYFTETTIEQKGDAWCSTSMSAGGDEAWAGICIDPSGPTEGSFGWAGGSVHENTFTRAK